MIFGVQNSIRAKLLGAVGAVSAAAVAVGVIAGLSLGNLNQSMHQIVDVSAEKVNLASQIRYDLMAMSRNEKSMILETEDAELESLSAKSEEADEHMHETIERLNAIADDVTGGMLASFGGHLAQYEAVNAQIRTLALAHEDDEALALATGDGYRLSDLCKKDLDELVDYSLASLEKEKAAAYGMYKRTKVVMGAVAIGGIALGVGLACFIIRGVAGALRPVIGRATQIAESDLSGEPLAVRTSDETGELTRSVNAMWESLRVMVGQVTSASSEVSAVSTQIAASAEEMSVIIAQQSDQVVQVSAAVEEMSQSVSEVANKATEAADNAQESGRLAADGRGVVQGAVDTMIEIDGTVSQSSEAVQLLGQRGQQIGEIVEVIQEIADQTNLLALNASIEAARAGEHGRGFAVVADEVRKLADRTAKATGEISESIGAIQGETRDAVDRMEASCARAQSGVEQAQSAGESLDAIVSRAQSVGQMITSIAAAAEQQSSASTEVSQSVESINAIMQQASAGASEAAAGATSLSTMAENLQHTVSRFRL